MYNGFTNKITFTHKKRKFVLHPLTPTQVVDDQVRMKNKIDEEERKEKKEENKNSTYMHTSKTKCSNCLGRKHKLLCALASESSF